MVTRDRIEPAGGESTPFVHRFRTSSAFYVYDVNTRRIVKVARVVWEILGDVGCLDETEIVAKHDTFPAEQVRRALKQIELAQRQGLFLASRPSEVVPIPAAKICRQVDEQREQLILNVTESCNFRCTYCVYGGQYSDQRTHSGKRMSWEVARLAIDDFLRHSRGTESPVITFYGGEPLLIFDLIKDCVAYAKAADRQGLQFGLTTNGFLLKGDIAAFLASEEFRILISLDGPAEVHDQNRKTSAGDGTFSVVSSCLEEFLETYPQYRSNGRLSLHAVVTETTDLHAVERFFSSNSLVRCAEIQISMQKPKPGNPADPGPGGDYLESAKGQLHEHLLEQLKNRNLDRTRVYEGCRAAAALFAKGLIDFHKRGFRKKAFPQQLEVLNTCVPGVRRTFVDANGQYFACERVAPGPAASLGNVFEGMDASRVLVLLKEWNRIVNSSCRTCWCLASCNVGCFATIDLNKEDGSSCAAFRRDRDNLLRYYSEILENNPKAFAYASEFKLT